MEIKTVLALSTAFLALSVSTMSFSQVVVTPSAADAPSAGNPVYVYCDTTSQANMTSSSASTVSCGPTTQNLNLYTMISGQCYPCTAPLSNGDLAGANGSPVDNGCAVVGDATNLNLSPISTFSANAPVAASFCNGAPPPTGTLSAPSNVQATNTTQTGTTITWTASTDSANANAVITYSVAFTPSVTVQQPAPNTTSVAVAGLAPSTQYQVTVSATDPANETPVAAAPIMFTTQGSAPGPSAVQKQLFQTFGVGTNLNSHYQNNSLNAIYYAFLQNDIQQLGSSGFKTVRFYNLDTNTYIRAIQAVAAYNQANPSAPVQLIYQYSLCKSDAAKQISGSNVCLDVKGGQTTIAMIEQGETAKLKAVIAAVTPAVFQQVVPLVIVGNEDLVIGSDKKSYNDADITNALTSVQGILQSNGVNNMPLSSDLVVFNIHYATIPTATAFTNVISHPAHTGPVLMNIYPYQLNAGNADGTNAVCPNGGKDNPTCTSQVNALYSLVTAAMTPTASTPAMQPYATLLANAVQQKGFMIGETGWPNAGTPYPGEYMTMRSGSVTATQNYMNDVIKFANNYNIPVLLFEAYDEPMKAGPTDPESHYGMMSWNNNSWITVSENGITLSSTATDANNPYYFDPTLFAIIAPSATVSGTLTTSSNPSEVITFSGPYNSAFKPKNGDTITLKETGASQSGQCSPPMYCTATFNGTAFTSSGNCNNSALSGINWSGSPVSSGMLPTLQLALPTQTMCNGIKPGSITFTLYPAPAFSGSISVNGTLTNIPTSSAPLSVGMADQDTVIVTSNCTGGGSLVCQGTYSAASQQITNVTETSPNSGSGDCTNMYVSGIDWTSSQNALHPGAPAQSACTAN